VEGEDDGSSLDEDDEDLILGESSNTSIWDSEYEQTSVYVGAGVDEDTVREQVTDAIKRANRTPTYLLSRPDVSFAENETTRSSLMLDDTEEDACIPLHRILTGPVTDPGSSAQEEANTSQPGPNDSFNSLYDIYSGLASPQDILTDSMRNARFSPLQPEATLSSISTLDSSMRGRVFTPPPHSFSSAVNAETINLTSSPLTSLDSISGRGSPSPLGHEDSAMSTGKHVAESTESRKVPIASRSRSVQVCPPLCAQVTCSPLAESKQHIF
jgi:uncharacterized protein (UPF0248 family)